MHLTGYQHKSHQRPPMVVSRPCAFYRDRNNYQFSESFYVGGNWQSLNLASLLYKPRHRDLVQEMEECLRLATRGYTVRLTLALIPKCRVNTSERTNKLLAQIGFNNFGILPNSK